MKEVLLSSTKKNFICSESLSDDELLSLIKLAKDMKNDPFSDRWNAILKNKKFLMIFYNPSLRTHLSFEAAVTELGGHPIFRSPSMNWSQSQHSIKSSESLVDVARVVSRYADGVGIRITMDAVEQYGDGYRTLVDFARHASIPVISMADDCFHPCQGLSDIMCWSEAYSQDALTADVETLQGKTLMLTWGSSGFARPFASVQSHLLLASRLGMNVNLAYPEGYDLDPAVTARAQQYCKRNGRQYQVYHDPISGYDNAEVVYVRNWVSPNAYQHNQFQYEAEIEKALSLNDWIVTKEKMSRTNNAVFSNPMPVDRGREAEDAVVDSPRSVIYDVAENRKHIQKAVLATLLGRGL